MEKKIDLNSRVNELCCLFRRYLLLRYDTEEQLNTAMSNWHEEEIWQDKWESFHEFVQLGIYDCLCSYMQATNEKNINKNYMRVFGDKLVALVPIVLMLDCEINAKVTPLLEELHLAHTKICNMPKEIFRNIAGKRYKESRSLLQQLADVARKKWGAGSPFLHHQMKEYLLNDYVDEKGRLTFMDVPEKTALKVLKAVAREIGRPELISGQRKARQ